MILGSIARRYAQALFDLAVEQGRVEQWSDALAAFKQAVESSAELRDVLVNPVYVKEQRRAIAAQLAAALKLDAEPANLLSLLADRNRFAYLTGIVDHFRSLADKKLGRLRARVVSATPLDPAVAQQIADRLAGAARANVIVEHHVDPSLLGGVVAQVGNLVYDGSVRTQLEDLRQTLKQ
ncbi:F0F1 ATP synthase subunit delta [Anaeromyxobacter paludicola]|uniref:ATP synthase subunit delta n=1 Tax=Anaeromyxobacter paludicola TaxID=2918171 RepID=A0ABN6N8Z2_9BACT|nr:F0F1 ATP synthase subunit delta [Anaeromyxobacter paludicola]BDG09707.1 ATP synthase subunit delta [Anaeromyxobacter paludicola]